MEILGLIEKLGIPTFWGYLMYLLLRDIIKNLFNGFNEKIDITIDRIDDTIEKIDELLDKIDKIAKEKEKIWSYSIITTVVTYMNT